MNNDNIIVCNTDAMKPPKVGNTLYESRSNTLEAFSDGDISDISIVVIAYNRIEKTKNCINYILEYTRDFCYNLLLCDNGSSDGTLEYFKSIDHPNKKVIRVTKNIGAGFAASFLADLANTRYYVGVNNDTYVTPNWLSNMMNCMNSDERIGYVTPMSSNISNFQDPGLKFSSLDEMQRVAKKFNISDPRKWQERKRLLSIAALFKREVFEQVGRLDCGFFHDFADDDWSLRISRSGYKQVLCGDTFIHHDHDFLHGEDKDIEQYNNSLAKGRMNFTQKHYGLDAWSDLVNYECQLLDLGNFHINPQTTPGILGIDTMCGVPILEIKNKVRYMGIFNADLYAYTTDAKYFFDLLTVCDGNVKSDRIDFINDYYQKNSFAFIILGQPLNLYANPFKVLDSITDLLNNGGQAFIKVKNTLDVQTLLCIYGNTEAFHEKIFAHICIDDMISFLKQKGITNIRSDSSMYEIDKALSEALNNSVPRLVDKNKFKQIYVNEYLFCLKKD